MWWYSIGISCFHICTFLNLSFILCRRPRIFPFFHTKHSCTAGVTVIIVVVVLLIVIVVKMMFLFLICLILLPSFILFRFFVFSSSSSFSSFFFFSLLLLFLYPSSDSLSSSFLVESHPSLPDHCNRHCACLFYYDVGNYRSQKVCFSISYILGLNAMQQQR